MAEAFLESIGTAELLPIKYQEGYNAGRASMAGEYTRGYNAGYAAGQASVSPINIGLRIVNVSANKDDPIGSIYGKRTFTGPGQNQTIYGVSRFYTTSHMYSDDQAQTFSITPNGNTDVSVALTYSAFDFHVSRNGTSWSVWFTYERRYGSQSSITYCFIAI